ncbi:SIR2 family protein [Vibrio cyclitrophicus]|uniref:SIR2 family protein n=1 Tax=Vibrio cyclitrophicus TaxID=47951 RepID=UPI00399ACD9C
MAIKTRPQMHLTNILKSSGCPNFTLFLGAGASVTSGVDAASELIKQWRSTYSEMYPDTELDENSWYNSPTEYSELFELLYDQPSQRREFIENCIKDALPSWGYIYLANLLKHNKLNTVFTTNFDDLINEACYSFSSDLKPLVSAHDSSITSVRLTSPRPKIIKLHGDFLFDNIKNTVRELDSLEDNMRSKFKQFASEFGMIVVGYSGHDRSIMETLNTLLRHDHNFPHGIYWCVRKGTDLDKLPKDLEDLTRFPRFHVVTIDGFDELMAEFHSAMKLNIQDEVSRPYQHLAGKLDKFVKRNSIDEEDDQTHPIIHSDINQLKDNIQKIHIAIEFVEKLEEILEVKSEDLGQLGQAVKQLSEDLKPISSKISNDTHLIATPKVLLADFAFRDSEYDEALSLSKRALDSRVTIEALAIYMRSANRLNILDDKKAYAFKKLNSIKTITEQEAARLNSVAVDFIEHSNFTEATDVLDFILTKAPSSETKSFIVLNQGLIQRLQGSDLSEDLHDELSLLLDRALSDNEHWLKLGLSLILNIEEVTLNTIDYLDESELFATLTKSQPIMRLMSESVFEKVKTVANTAGISLDNDDAQDDVEENVTDIEAEQEENVIELPEKTEQPANRTH